MAICIITIAIKNEKQFYNFFFFCINFEQNSFSLIRFRSFYEFKVNQIKSLYTIFTQVIFDDVPIPSSPTVKYICLTIDRRLSWAQHIPR